MGMVQLGKLHKQLPKQVYEHLQNLDLKIASGISLMAATPSFSLKICEVTDLEKKWGPVPPYTMASAMHLPTRQLCRFSKEMTLCARIRLSSDPVKMLLSFETDTRRSAKIHARDPQYLGHSLRQSQLQAQCEDYSIAENFRGRKLLRISRIWAYQRKLYPRIKGHGQTVHVFILLRVHLQRLLLVPAIKFEAMEL